MNHLVLDGVTYIKSSVAGRELGYTADYVGQLCRAKKVDAQLVGRSWYVSMDSLRAHKVNRYGKSTETTSTTKSTEVKKTIPANSSSTKQIRQTKPAKLNRDQSIARRDKEGQPKASNQTSAIYNSLITDRYGAKYSSNKVNLYEPDSAELIPRVRKIKVQNENQESTINIEKPIHVDIVSDNVRHTYKTVLPEPVKTKGRIKVTEVSDESDSEEVIDPTNLTESTADSLAVSGFDKVEKHSNTLNIENLTPDSVDISIHTSGDSEVAHKEINHRIYSADSEAELTHPDDTQHKQVFSGVESFTPGSVRLNSDNSKYKRLMVYVFIITLSLLAFVFLVAGELHLDGTDTSVVRSFRLEWGNFHNFFDVFR